MNDQVDDPRLYRWRFGAAEFDEARFELRVGGLPVEMEHKPLQVLARLLQHPGEVVTKDELFDSVWAGRVTVDHVLSTAVGKLRKALGEEGSGAIVTVPRVGYRLDGHVERIAVGHRAGSALHLEAGQPVPGREHFLLERQLGQTRGSEVWLARQSRSREARVFKFGLDGERLSAIKREATLARVLRDTLGERPDLVRVFDWNFEAEPYFLESEYGGDNLAEWAAGDVAPARWPLAQRVAFFLQIVDAVAAAHSIGVLHKDLKPANVLVQARPDGVDGYWQARLTDFGSSRLLQPERLAELGITALGMTVTGGAGSDSDSGTPLYLAPEVMAGQPCTVQSDVYALGVMLYQWLAGDLRRPMASGWERDIDDALLREDIARATDGNPARRLDSAKALAECLRTLQARHAERAQRVAEEDAARQARRALERARARRPWLAATATALVLGLLGSLWFAWQAEHARRATERQVARADAVRGFLQDLLSNADPGNPAEGHELTVREALTRASSDITRRFAKTPDTEASVRLTAGSIYTSLGEFDHAQQNLQRAVALLTQTTGAGSQQTLRARYQLAAALAAASHYAEAERELRATDADAGARFASDPQLVLASAQAWGRDYLLKGDAKAAAPKIEAAIALQLQVDPGDAPNLYALRSDLAQSYVRIGRQDDAVALMRELQDPKYAKAGVSASKRASGLLLYGSALLYAERTKEAEPILHAALDAINATFGVESLQAAQAQSALGNLYATQGDFRKALPYVVAAGDRVCALHGPTHQFCLQQRGNEGVIRSQLGDAAGALPKLKAAYDGFLAQIGPDSPGTHVLGYYLASALLETGDVADAAKLVPTLDAKKLLAGSPGEQWDARLAALKASVLIDEHHTTQGMAMLQPAVAEMEKAGTQAWIMAPFERRLAANR